MRSGRLIRALVPSLSALALMILAVAAVSGGQAGVGYVPKVEPAGLLPMSMGPNSPHPYAYSAFPSLPFSRGVKTAQTGSGPVPDTDLNPNTPETSEIEPNAAPGTMDRVAFATNGVDADKNGYIDPTAPADAHYNIWLMRPDGSQCQQVTDLPGDATSPCWDPSGRWIAYSYSTTADQADIYTINLNTNAIYRITSGPGIKTHPTYSPDGNYIAYATNQNGNWDIYKVPASGSGMPTPVVNTAADEMDPAYSPVSKEIAFTGVSNGHKRIFVVDDSGANREMLSSGGSGGTADDEDPAWLPTGTAIAFASNRKTSGLDAYANFNIWQMSSIGEVNGPEAMLLTDKDEKDQGDNLNPTWSPNLSRSPVRLFFQSNRSDPTSGNYDIWTMLQTDNQPPTLGDTPWVTSPLPASQARGEHEFSPGADVAIHVPAFDAGSGVAKVTAILRDPDQKQFVYNIFSTDPLFDSGYSNGIRALEPGYQPDYAQVGAVELFDDGSQADSDATAGDGVFSGVVTLPNVARDYLIDIVVQDNAGNVFTYDDVAGFTTISFQPKTNILFVDDYCEGQQFFWQSGLTNDFPVGWGVESFYRSNPGTSPDVDSTVDHDSIRGYYNENYDVWRIICRGPVPAQVYQYYLPTVEYQLDPSEAISDPEGAQATRRVLVANRAIIWACPHAGDVWTGTNSGTLLDVTTQADLGRFLDRGGRLFLSGEDIVWALTLNGTVQNNFVTQYLHCQFLADTPTIYDYYLYGYGLGTQQILHCGYSFTVSGNAGDPVADDPWAGTGYSHVGPFQQSYDSDDQPLSLVTPRIVPNGPDYTDASEFSLRPDEIQPLVASEELYGYPSYPGTAMGIRYADPTTGAKVVFLSFGFEQIHRGYHSPANLPPHCENHRSHLIHDAMCWMRTGGFQGRVISSSDGGKPISTQPYPIVYFYRGNDTTPDYAVRCQADGTFVAQGLQSGGYTIQATRPGYTIDHYDGQVCHGGLSLPVIDFVIKRAASGGINGVVTSEATGDPIGNVLITITPVPTQVTLPDGTTQTEDYPPGTTASDWPVTTHTAPDGTYNVGDLPPWDYQVTADGSAADYGTAGPQAVTVTSNNTFEADFALSAANGTVPVKVVDKDSSQPITGATVQLLSGAKVAASGTTDSTGEVSISVQPGTYSVVADAAGYGKSTGVNVDVVSAQTANLITIQMTPQPPGSISGRVVSATTGTPVGGVTVVMSAPGRADVSVVTTSSLQTDTTGGSQYNFKFTSAPAGTVTITPQPVGFSAQPASAQVEVTSGQLTSDVVFRLTSLHTFAQGLSLISLPGDYTAFDPATVLNIASGQRLLMAAWEASRQAYAAYPQAPADLFRPATGYWVFLNGATDLSRTGKTLQPPYELPVSPTWDLIGDPFNTPIDVYSIKVRDANNVVMDWQTARAQGKILSVLWAYVLGGYQPSNTLAPYVGYWVAVSEPLTFIIDSTQTAAATPAKSAMAEAVGSSGWAVPLVVKSGSCQDSSLYLGVAPGASDGFDPGIDQPKPPAPTMGPYVSAAAATSDKAMGGLAVDMRAHPGGTYKVVVRTSMAGEPVTVTWPDLSALPSDVKPYLVDPVANRRLYMRTTSSYTYTDQSGSRDLEVQLAVAGSGALAVTALQAVPAGGGAQVTYSLSCGATVDISVLNVSGVPVRKLASAKVQPAGLNQVTWDGRNDMGARVPAGRYLVVVRAATDEGEQTQGVAAVSLGK